MTTNHVEDLITEVLMYLHNSNSDHLYDKMIDRVVNLKSTERTKILLDDCIDLRENTLSFQIRETQKRVSDITKLINDTRFCAKNKTHEAACLDSLYQQSKQVNERMCLLYKLDYLLLTVTNIVINNK